MWGSYCPNEREPVETSEQSHVGRGKCLLQHRNNVPLGGYVVDGFRSTLVSSIRKVRRQTHH